MYWDIKHPAGRDVGPQVVTEGNGRKCSSKGNLPFVNVKSFYKIYKFEDFWF